jgi:(4-(4-[2-(gamma-L-glutamylamino)ethyl]phenoxymethyl)furan-2-yl)methanamine synthase
LVNVLGFDIGGANTKAAFVCVKNGKQVHSEVAFEYFPVWKQQESLSNVLLMLKQRLGASDLNGVGVTMTAELSDAYQTKREGVNHILGCTKQAFPEVPIYVLNTDAKLEPLNVAIQQPLSVAAANWAATGWLVAQHLQNCVVVDVGSTSTSIIPIIKSKVAANGKTDLEKLLCGELVYTGGLRTNVVSIVKSIPIRNDVAGVSSELFALSGDVHLVLGNTTVTNYTSETADGRGKTIPEALARLARVVCADTEMLSQQEIMSIAQYIYDNQILQVMEGLKKVYFYTKSQISGDVPVVVAGLGKDFLARKAAESLGIYTIVDLEILLPEKAVLATPALGVALMTANKMEGEIIK